MAHATINPDPTSFHLEAIQPGDDAVTLILPCQ